MSCEGCTRMVTDRHTIRFWSQHDPDGPVSDGHWMHVDPSGQSYDCDIQEGNDDELL